MHKKINNCFISDFITRNVCCSINIPSKARTLLAFATFFFHAVLDCKLWICHPARRGEALLQTQTVLVPARLVLRRKLELVFDPEITTCELILLDDHDTTTANCSKLVFLCVYVCTIKVTRKSHVVYTPHIQIRSYHSAKECWELESAAISDKIRSFNRAKQDCAFSMVPSQISKLFFAFIIVEILTGLRKK